MQCENEVLGALGLLRESYRNYETYRKIMSYMEIWIGLNRQDLDVISQQTKMFIVIRQMVVNTRD
jgi:hypothetical protein